MAGLYPEEIIQEVLSANNIVDLIGSYITLKRAGRGYMGLCPFHREKSPSFHVSEDKQLYHCFGCGVGGNAIHFVMASENLDFVDALKYLADKGGIILPETDNMTNEKERHEKRQKMYEANLEVARYFREMLNSKTGENALSYIKKRGLSESTVKHFGMGYAPEGGLLDFLKSKNISTDIALSLGLIMVNDRGGYTERFRNRLMVPIIDVRKRIIGFGGRALSPDAKAKYMNSPESMIFQKGKELFALNYAKGSKDSRIILCEGYMDVISLHQAGFTGAVASMGTALTTEQARVLKKYSSEVYLCYDSDGPGQKATEAAMEIFSPLDIKVRVLSLPEGKDPDEFIKLRGQSAFENVLGKAKSRVEYKLYKLREKYDIKDVDQKIEFTSLAADILLKISSRIEKEAYIKKLSEETGISEDSIYAEMIKKGGAIKKKEDRKIFTKPVGKNATQNRDIKDASPKLTEAERILLSLMARDKRVFEMFSKDRPPESYSIEAHRMLAKALYEELADGKAVDVSVIITKLPSDYSGLLSAVFSDDDYGDEVLAAQDAVNTIEDAEFDKLSKQYLSENNIAKLNELIKKKAEKKRKEGLK